MNELWNYNKKNARMSRLQKLQIKTTSMTSNLLSENIIIFESQF